MAASMVTRCCVSASVAASIIYLYIYLFIITGQAAQLICPGKKRVGLIYNCLL